MREYTVKSGDTLGKIAKSVLGSAGKWRILADLNNLSNPNRLKVGQLLKIPAPVSSGIPSVLNPSIPSPDRAQEVAFSEESGRIYVNDMNTGEKIFLGKKFRKGLSRHGVYQPEEFIRASASRLSSLHLSQSEINVLLPVAENEGALDAVNTWDAHYLSFGMFQWTAGRVGETGELA